MSILEAVLDLLGDVDAATCPGRPIRFPMGLSGDEERSVRSAMGGLALSHPTFHGRSHSRAQGEQTNWTVRATSASGIGAKIWISETPDDGLVGFRLGLDRIATAQDFGELVTHLRTISSRVGVCAMDQRGETNCWTADGDRIFAVSSLMKLAVVLAAGRKAASGPTVEHRLRIREGAMSYLTGGLDERSIGKEISVSDLCHLSLQYSDNTAQDLLLGWVGEECVQRVLEEVGTSVEVSGPVRTTRDLIEASWADGTLPRGCARSEIDSYLRSRSVQEVVFREGLDYRMDLASTNRLAARLLREMPSQAMSINQVFPGFFFKGGSSPGVLAGVWADVSEPARSVSIALNGECPFGALEELWVFELVLSYLQNRVQGGESSDADV